MAELTQGNIVNFESALREKLSLDRLLDLADLALASNGFGDYYVNRDEVGMQIKRLSADDALEHMQQFVNKALEGLFGERAQEFIRPLSSYEKELNDYQTALRSAALRGSRPRIR